jgi:voltage-gated sodium channel
VLRQRAAALAEARGFNLAILGVILANAVVIGLETFPGVARDAGDTLDLLNDVFLGVFVAELGVRFAACGGRPWRFFRDGWNTFDFVVVGAAFVPGLRENATLLRLVRLARIVRLFRLLPDLRILVVAVARSVPGVASLALVTVVVVYLYAMAGWTLFSGADPDRFGTVADAMLTMFVLLSLEGLPEAIDAGRGVSRWAVPFYVSYVLVAAFLIFNLFIGVVISSLEQAREIEGRDDADALERVTRLREELEHLEAVLRRR